MDFTFLKTHIKSIVLSCVYLYVGMLIGLAAKYIYADPDDEYNGITFNQTIPQQEGAAPANVRLDLYTNGSKEPLSNYNCHSRSGPGLGGKVNHLSNHT